MISKRVVIGTLLTIASVLLGATVTATTPTLTSTPTLDRNRCIRLPAIDADDGWETRIQMQNVGDANTGAVILFWGDYSDLCPPDAPGPVAHLCYLIPGSWGSVPAVEIPAEAKSAIVYSVSDDLFQAACEAAGGIDSYEAWIAWEDIYAYTGEALAVTANRLAYNGSEFSGMYNGFSETMLGSGPAFLYYAPLQAIGGEGQEGATTQLVIQNAVDACTSAGIYYTPKGSYTVQKAQYIERIAPGEAIRVGHGGDVGFPPEITIGWQGSVYITSAAPLAVVVDQWDADSNMLLTYAGVPADYGATTNYAPLVYRDYDGWDTQIQVQNLIQHDCSFVTVDFRNMSGEELLLVGKWICMNDTAIFYTPDIFDLGVNSPSGYIGTAEIQSHEQAEWPLPEPTGPPIVSVVSLINSDNGEALSYNALPSHQATGVITAVFPLISRQSPDRTSEIAIMNPSNCLANDIRIDFYDEDGQLVSSVWKNALGPKHLDYIDVANYGNLPPEWVGGMVATTVGSENLCDPDGEGEPAMAALAIGRRIGYCASGQECFPIIMATETPTTVVWIDPPDQTTYLDRGDFTVDVTITDVIDLGSFQFTLAFSPTIVHVEGVELGDLLGSTGRSTVPLGPEINNEGGTVIFGAFSYGGLPGPDGSGVLATISFSPQAAGEGDLHLQSVLVTNTATPEGIPVELQDGRVTVQECIPGDLDCNCDVDIEDIMLVADRWNTAEGDPDYDPFYDLDDDGDIDIVDIMLVVVHWGDTCPG